MSLPEVSVLTSSTRYFPNPGLSKEYGSGPYAQDDVSVFGALMTEARDRVNYTSCR